MRKAAILIIGIILTLMLVGCSAQEAVYTHLSAADDDGQVVIRGRTGDSTYQVPRVDPASHVLINIDYEHGKVHDGDAYFVTGNDDDIDVGELFNLTVITPDTTTWLHVNWAAEGISETHIFVYEGVTVNVPGAVKTAINRDRNSINTSKAILRENDTITDNGTLLWEWHVGGKKETGSAATRDEMILKQNTTYLFEIESEIINNKVSGQLSWYEHTNRSP